MIMDKDLVDLLVGFILLVVIGDSMVLGFFVGKAEIIEIDNSTAIIQSIEINKDNKCEYMINNKFKLIDNCNKYKIGDNVFGGKR